MNTALTVLCKRTARRIAGGYFYTGLSIFIQTCLFLYRPVSFYTPRFWSVLHRLRTPDCDGYRLRTRELGMGYACNTSSSLTARVPLNNFLTGQLRSVREKKKEK